jgi:ADP-ribose pyrophosphatase YjhB (NUDIX family)
MRKRLIPLFLCLCLLAANEITAQTTTWYVKQGGAGDMEVNGQVVYGYIGGGFYNVASTVTLTYVHITGNWTRNHGGGMTNRSGSVAALTNVTVANNHGLIAVDYFGGGLWNTGDLTVRNSIIWGNTLNVHNESSGTVTCEYTLLEGATPGDGIISAADPLFVAPVAMGVGGSSTAAGDYRLRHCSPARNVGDDSYNAITLDPAGNQRKEGIRIDLGAYEVQTADEQLKERHNTEWINIKNVGPLILDHRQFLDDALRHLRRRSATHPVGFNLLPEQFTLPQLQSLYEAIYARELDKRNFRKKILEMGVLEKLDKKDKSSSKRGAFYYKFNKEKYDYMVENELDVSFI